MALKFDEDNGCSYANACLNCPFHSCLYDLKPLRGLKDWHRVKPGSFSVPEINTRIRRGEAAVSQSDLYGFLPILWVKE